MEATVGKRNDDSEKDSQELDSQAKELHQMALGSEALQDLGKELRAAFVALGERLDIEIKTGGNQIKFGTSKQFVNQGLAAVHSTTQYEDQMRWCRILSTCARGFLLHKGESPVEEVQCTYDSCDDVFTICTNQPSQTKLLKESDWTTWILTDQKAKFNAHKSFTSRFEAHRRLLQNAARGHTLSKSDSASSTFPESEELEVESCSSSSGTKDRRKRSFDEAKTRTTMPDDWTKKLKYVVGDKDDKIMHTESKILTTLRDELSKRDPKTLEERVVIRFTH